MEDFFKAIKEGNFDEVKRLISLDPELINNKENGISPVLIAAYNNQPKIADFLVEKTGALNIFEASAMGRTPQIMRHLARNPELVNAYAEDGFQPLGLACFFGQLETVEYLLKAGASPNSPSRNPQKFTPLHSAAAAKNRQITMTLLLKGADPNVRESNGYTPLHTAAQNGDIDTLRALLFNGADTNVKSNDGKTPLDLAKEGGHQAAVDLLKQGITRRFRGIRLNL